MVVKVSIDWIIGAVLIVFLLIPIMGIVVAMLDLIRWKKRRK